MLLIEEEQTPDEMWSKIKDNIHEAAKNVPLAKHKKDSWISNCTLDLIDLKRKAKRIRPEEYKSLQKKFGTRMSEGQAGVCHSTI